VTPLARLPDGADLLHERGWIIAVLPVSTMLYEAHFGLTDLPFRNTPDPRYVCWLPQYEQALAMVEYAIEEREMVLLTGDIGVGKTTVIRAALQQVEAATARVVVLVYPRMTPYQLLAQLATALEVPPARSRYVLMNQLAERLVDLWQEGCRVALVLDEAHLLPSKAVFDEIRFLSNLQLDTANLLGIVLVGQPEVETTLRRRAYAAFRQRISMHLRLRPLQPEEVTTYIRHRWEQAGGTWPGPFRPDALEAIAALSQGYPRVINHLAHLALMEAFAQDRPAIDADLVRSVRSALVL